MRYNFTVKYVVLEYKGKLLFPQEKMKQTHVYADSKEEAVKQLEKEGYEVIE
jgi:hypothetical protein